MTSQLHPKWNADKTGLAFAWGGRFAGNAPTTRLLNCLAVSVSVDGRQLPVERWGIGADGSAKTSVAGLELELEIKQSGSVQATLTNRSSSRVTLDKFSFAAMALDDASDILTIPGPRLRVHKEGLTMATPAASLRYGEPDFELNPEYKPFAVLTPSEYHDDCPNKFSGEYAIVLNDRESGASALFGFVSSCRQFTRLAVDLVEPGIARLEAISCCDGIAVDPGERVRSEELAVFASFDAYGLLEEFASLWGKRMGARMRDHTPTGWCSWYYYFSNITEKDMLENIRWLKDNKSEFPLEYIQLDEGYQAALGDWLVCNEKFPNGLKSLAKETTDAGFKAGLWLAPFWVEEGSRLYKDHPAWVIRDIQGQTVWALKWRDAKVALLDCTLPPVCEWLAETFATLRRWGYDYVKLDFMTYELGAISLGGRYADPKATRAQAIRRGLEAMRQGFGDDGLMMGCTCPFGPEVGVMDAARISTDITPYWQRGNKIFKEAPAVPNVCRNIINRHYMHKRLWLNDPDTHIARLDNNELTEAEVKLWTSAVWLTGGSLFLSDRFSKLTPERAELSKTLLRDPEAFREARPLDFLEREYPAIWFARRTGDNNACAIGVFNFENTPKIFQVKLPVDGAFNAREHWSGEDCGKIEGAFTVEIAPRSCKLFMLELAQ